MRRLRLGGRGPARGRCCSRPATHPQGSRSRPHVAGHRADAPAPILRHQGARDLAPLGELDDVAADLGDRGGDDVWSDSEKPARAAASRPCCLAVTTSASRDTRTRTTPSSSAGRPRRSKRVGELRARRALDEVAVDVQLPLTTPAAPGERPPHGPAAIGGRRAAAAARRYSTRRPAPARLNGPRPPRHGAELSRHRPGVVRRRHVGHQEVPVGLGELGQRGADELRSSCRSTPAVGARFVGASSARRADASDSVRGRSARRSTRRRVEP